MENKKIICSFATMASNGKEPAVEIHAAGIEEDGGIAVTVSIKGGASDIAAVISNIVENAGKSILETDGIVGAAAFVEMIGTAVCKGAGREAALMAALVTGDKAKKIMEEMKEKEEDDGEPV